MAEATSAAAVAAASVAPEVAGAAGPAKITAAELAAHSKASDCWMVIEGKVYDVTDFVDEHPGGDEVLLAEAGKDATEAFDDVGHSDDARALLMPMYKGDLEGAVVSGDIPQGKAVSKDRPTQTPILMFIPIGILLAYYAYQYYQEQQQK